MSSIGLRPKYSLDAKRNLAAAMRAKPTNAEAAMWELLRADAFGVRFRRQITIGGWIIDFFCPTLRLAIEVDGSSHENEEAKETDRIKDLTLVAKGITVVRFDNEDVLHFPGVVCLRVAAECKALGLDKSVSRQSLKGVAYASRSARQKPNSLPAVITDSCARVEKSLKNDAQPKPAVGVTLHQKVCKSDAFSCTAHEQQRITRQEHEQLMQKIVRLSRQRSMNFGLPPDNRSSEEKAADLRYRFNELQARKARTA